MGEVSRKDRTIQYGESRGAIATQPRSRIFVNGECSEMTIGKKIGLACAALVGFTIVTGAAALINISLMESRLEALATDSLPGLYRSEERRVGKECRSRCYAYQQKK